MPKTSPSADEAGPRSRSPYTLGAALRRQALLIAVLVALVLILAIGLAGEVPAAGAALGGLLLVVALLRCALPVRRLGALVVRARWIDVSVLCVLGTGLLLMSGAPNL